MHPPHGDPLSVLSMFTYRSCIAGWCCLVLSCAFLELLSATWRVEIVPGALGHPCSCSSHPLLYLPGRHRVTGASWPLSTRAPPADTLEQGHPAHTGRLGAGAATRTATATTEPRKRVDDTERAVLDRHGREHVVGARTRSRGSRTRSSPAIRTGEIMRRSAVPVMSTHPNVEVREMERVSHMIVQSTGGILQCSVATLSGDISRGKCVTDGTRYFLHGTVMGDQNLREARRPVAFNGPGTPTPLKRIFMALHISRGGADGPPPCLALRVRS